MTEQPTWTGYGLPGGGYLSLRQEAYIESSQDTDFPNATVVFDLDESGNLVGVEIFS